MRLIRSPPELMIRFSISKQCKYINFYLQVKLFSYYIRFILRIFLIRNIIIIKYIRIDIPKMPPMINCAMFSFPFDIQFVYISQYAISRTILQHPCLHFDINYDGHYGSDICYNRSMRRLILIFFFQIMKLIL